MRSTTPIARSLSFDASKWLPTEATRSTVGVALVLVVSTMLHSPGAGALASIGALYTGMAASSGVYHSRLRAMAASGLMIGLATTLGALIAISEAASYAAVIVAAFGTAMYASSSRIASTVGAQTTAMLCVVIGLRLPASGAAGDGLIVCAGAAAQLFLLTLVWPIKEGLQERIAVGDAFDALAAFVLEIPSRREAESPQIPPATQIQDARDMLSEAERMHWHSENDLLFQALRRAEAIRAALVGFAQADRQFSAVDRASKIRSDRILRSVARSLRRVGERARKSQLQGEPIVLKMPVLPDESPEAGKYRKWLQKLIDLIADTCRPQSDLPSRPAHSNLRSVFSALTRLPDIQAVRSVTIQHAVRYAVTVEIAFAISERWSKSHAYWLPMTVALVLRQDYGSTFQRGIGRLVGTLCGLAACDLILIALHPGTIALQVLTLVATWIAFSTILASYAVASAAMTGFVVFSIASSGVIPGDVGPTRLLASIAGSCLAVLSYILWPAWKWAQVWETLKSAAEAQAKYCEVVLKVHVARIAGEPRTAETDKEIDEVRAGARALRILSENLLEAIKMHPKGLEKHRLKIAGDASQLLEENAATILVAQAAWNTVHPETDEQLREALETSRGLVTQLSEVIR